MRGLSRRFGDLKIRPKLMVLHNVFFLLVASAVYFSLVPLIEHQVEEARQREARLIEQITGGQGGTAVQPASDAFQGLLASAKGTLFVALAVTYVLTVLVLELVIMPAYVYRPLRLMLDADEATQRGDRERELIDERAIPGDELGQIMQSRNATVSELRKHERQLELTLARLEMVKRSLEDRDRLASLGVMCASVAHELNTPLAVLRGSIEKMLETTPDKSARQELDRMMRVTGRLQQISESLLDFSRVRREGKRLVSLHSVIEESWMLAALDEKSTKVQFRNHVRDEDLVIGNQDQLVQVFVNLLQNSLHAIPGSGNIVVESRRLSVGSHEWIGLSVEDDGQGIPAEILADIFDAFVSGRVDGRGTGLGLAVAQGIVSQHGGTIEAANRSGGGARLEVRLPAARTEVIA